MEAFLRSDQYNYIKRQTQNLINGYSTANDQEVLDGLKSLTEERVFQLVDDISSEQKQLLAPIVRIKDRSDMDQFLMQIKPYVIPFSELTEQKVKKIFPKAKKLKMPSLDQVDWSAISYLGWNDLGSQKKFIIMEDHHRFVGMQGSYRSLHQKGICAICKSHQEVGMFISEEKGTAKGTFVKRGNYICQDSDICNENLMNREQLTDFFDTFLK